jgi:predicted enzyme related to lactoylglutathione lyase
MQLDGERAAAIAPQPAPLRDAGAPPAWQSYITVGSADASAQLAEQAGATVLAPPFDVMGAGRMAALADPQGAAFCVWEPRENIGATIVNGPGALAWNELATSDPDGASKFYGEVFGWTFNSVEGMGQPYSVILNAGRSNGGIHPADPPAPPYWLAYFGTPGIEAGLERARELGGTVHAGPIDIGIAKIGIVADPQGAIFALYDGEFED